MFSNAITQAWRSDFEVATDPKTRSGFWFKTAVVNLLPKLLMAAAVSGLLGEWLRRAYERMTEYDRTNYLPIPVGEDEHGNIVYVRLPQDDSGRVIGGVFWKTLRALRGDAEVAETITQVLDYSAGWRAWKKFLGWEFQQLGGGIVWKFYPGEERPRRESVGQWIVELPVLSNIIGRFIRITDYGDTEALRDVQRRVQGVEARRRLGERDAAYKAIQRFQNLPASQRSPGQIRALAAELTADLYRNGPSDGGASVPDD